MILCVGIAVCDVLIKPVSEETLARDTTRAQFVKLMGGGDAFNAAGNIASLGVPVRLVSGVGRDELGDLLCGSLARAGVEARLVEMDAPTSAAAVLIRPDGERSFVSFHGASHALSEPDVEDAAFDRAATMYVGSANGLPGLDGAGMARLFWRAKAAGLATALDVTGEVSPEKLAVMSDTLKHVDFFLPSLREARRLTGCERAMDAARALAALGPETVVIKCGPEGCVALSCGEEYASPGFAAEAVDTTGAGDAFVSGFLAAREKGYALANCLDYANAAGAVCVGQVGASGTLSGFGALQKMVNSRKDIMEVRNATTDD
jgi:sugar/nucleoside kinase (ribokinase family)